MGFSQRLRPAARAALALAALCAAGCASSPRRRGGVDVEKYLRDLEKQPAVASTAPAAAGDAPDSPVSSLPPPPPAASAAGAGAQPDGVGLTIQPECLLRITVKEDPSLNSTYPVNELGAVNFGYVGQVFLYNKTEPEAEQKIRTILEQRYLRRATVTVNIQRASYDKIRVAGAVGSPGVIRIGPGEEISLNDALLRAGGPRLRAEDAQVKIVREGLLSAVAQSLDGEIYNLVNEAGYPQVPDVMLRNNDILYVLQRPVAAPVVEGEGAAAGAAVGEAAQAAGQPKTILVLGEVKRKGFYSFRVGEPCTVMHLVFRMGGFPPYAKASKLKVVRRYDEGFEEEFVVNAQRLIDYGNPDDDFPLQDGDRVIVPAKRIALF